MISTGIVQILSLPLPSLLPCHSELVQPAVRPGSAVECSPARWPCVKATSRRRYPWFEGGLAHKPKTSQERKAERRREKLEEIRQQIAAGTLTVRQMTPAERKRHPPPARPAPRSRGTRFVTPRAPTR